VFCGDFVVLLLSRFVDLRFCMTYFCFYSLVFCSLDEIISVYFVYSNKWASACWSRNYFKGITSAEPVNR
jgi:hypothetical protein